MPPPYLQGWTFCCIWSCCFLRCAWGEVRDETAWNKQKCFPSLSTSELPGKESGVFVPYRDTVRAQYYPHYILLPQPDTSYEPDGCPSAIQMLKYHMQVLSRGLEKHPLAITSSQWTTLPLSHHRCPYNTTTLCHTVSLQNQEVFAFSHPPSPLLLSLLPPSILSCEQTCTPPTPHFCHQAAITYIESWHLSGDVSQQWEAEVDLCFGSSTRRTGPPGMPWWDCSAAAATGGGLAQRSGSHCEVEHPRMIPRRILPFL